MPLTVAFLFVSGCSGSSSSDNTNATGNATGANNPATSLADGSEGADGNEGTTGTPTGAAPEPTTVAPAEEIVNPQTATQIQVTFDITVPIYVSNALQVHVRWGEQVMSAAWVTDESWRAAASFPTNTQNLLTVTFSDNNGELVLATVEKTFNTGANATQTYRITADEFDAIRWDADNDGVSNLAESINGTNPTGVDLTEAPQVNLELVADKTFRLNWQTVPGAQFYRVLENPDGASGFVVVSEDLPASTMQYDHRVALYKKLNASYVVQACAQDTCIDSQSQQVPDVISGSALYVKASNAGASDRFGSAVSLSADGNTLAVGAYGELSASTGVNSDQNDNSLADAKVVTLARGPGAVYVFKRIDGQWQQQAYIKPSSIGVSDNFGKNLQLSADGNRLIVGAVYESYEYVDKWPYSNIGTKIIGAAYIFSLENGEWTQEAKLKPSILTDYDFFGSGVAMSGDGNLATVVGLYYFHYVYERVDGEWRIQADLSTNRDVECLSSESVAMSADGNTIITGRYGRLRAYKRNQNAWEFQACLMPTYVNVADDFGDTISLSADGNTVAVSAPRDEGAGVGINGSEQYMKDAQEGAVFVFTRSAGEWQKTAYIKSDASVSAQSFANRIALSSDAKTLVAWSSVGLQTYTFANDNWTLHSIMDRDQSDWLGSSLSLSANGDTLAGGSSGDQSAATGINGFRDDTSAPGAGAVFLY